MLGAVDTVRDIWLSGLILSPHPFRYMYIRQVVPKYREESEQDKGGVTTLNSTKWLWAERRPRISHGLSLDVTTWKRLSTLLTLCDESTSDRCFPRYGQVTCGTLMFLRGYHAHCWTNNRVDGDMRRHGTDVISLPNATINKVYLLSSPLIKSNLIRLLFIIDAQHDAMRPVPVMCRKHIFAPHSTMGKFDLLSFNEFWSNFTAYLILSYLRPPTLCSGCCITYPGTRTSRTNFVKRFWKSRTRADGYLKTMTFRRCPTSRPSSRKS